MVAVFAARVSLVAVPCNLVAELAVAPATVLGFTALAVAPLAMPLAEALARCAGWPAGWIASVARTGAALPGAEAAWPGGWWGGLTLAALTVLVLLAVRRIQHHPWTAAACAVLLLLAVLRPPPFTRFVTGWPPPGWTFAMCDVGQGDTAVLAAGDRTAVVVDAGPDPAPADRCLRALGVTRVPLLLLTHFHADHVAGLPGVLRGRAVGAIQTTTSEEPPEQAAFVRRTAAAARVPVVRAVPGEQRRVGPLTWRVLWPRAETGAVGPAGPATVEPNDSSVTLFVRIARGPSLLLLGDLEPPAQRGLLRDYPALPRADVLKVAHHGSPFQDPGLLHQVRPRLALISVGGDNSYGHPAPRTVDALRAGERRCCARTRTARSRWWGPGPGCGRCRRGATVRWWRPCHAEWRRFVTTVDGDRQVRTLGGEEEILATCRDRFGSRSTGRLWPRPGPVTVCNRRLRYLSVCLPRTAQE